MEFINFKKAVAEQFNLMKGYDLFRTEVDKDLLWDTYLSSFPAGSNPMYRERTEHDCNCCKSFIRTAGNIVAMIDGKLVSIWDVTLDDENYQVVANALSKLVKSKSIENIFLHYEKVAGRSETYEETPDGIKTWNHFSFVIPDKFVKKGDDIGTALGEAKAFHDVLFRGLNEISDDAVDMVLDLIAQNSLYKGEENKFTVSEFKTLKTQFNKLKTKSAKDMFAWGKSRTTVIAVSKIRNTSIGTLLTDLSEGVELEVAVKSFESKVAPANYKRPTALVSKAMIENAKKKVEELGLTSALNRRYAVTSDISINDVLFANSGTKSNMSDNIFDTITSKVPDKKPKSMDKIEEINIEKFIKDILPNINSMEIMLENSHINNLVSLIAPVDPQAGKLFKWNNPFSWSYSGDVTDSIKERVKKAGGNVEADLCCRLAWYNYDDLDVNMTEPDGNRIFYGDKGLSECGGQLDIDMNAGSGKSREAVENIFYKNKSKMKEGTYILRVNNYAKRENIDVGFEVEVDIMGTIHRFVYDKAVGNKETIIVAEINYSKTLGFSVKSSLPNTQVAKEVWGIQTGNYHQVNMAMLSPNHWEGSGVGNKHYFFMLNNCKNDGSARGFYNEFLKSDFDVHRKVFEIVGSKMKTAESINQLSGVGFSSTQRNSMLCKVSGSFNRVLKVLF